jgi:hypothetical protein
MEPRDELRMLVLFYVVGVIGIGELTRRLKTSESMRHLDPQENELAYCQAVAKRMLAACDEYSAPIRGWNVAELADRDQILVNKLKAAVQ